MSLKVHGGLKTVDSDVFTAAVAVKEVLDAKFFDLHKLVDEMVHKVLERKPNITWDALAGLSTPEWRFPVAGSDISLYTLKAIEAVKEDSNVTVNPFGIGYNACFLPNRNGGEPLLRVFSDYAAIYEKVLVDEGAATPYGYWDNADPEEDVSDAEWVERGFAWNVLMEEPYIFYKSALTLRNPEPRDGAAQIEFQRFSKRLRRED